MWIGNIEWSTDSPDSPKVNSADFFHSVSLSWEKRKRAQCPLPTKLAPPVSRNTHGFAPRPACLLASLKARKLTRPFGGFSAKNLPAIGEIFGGLGFDHGTNLGFGHSVPLSWEKRGGHNARPQGLVEHGYSTFKKAPSCFFLATRVFAPKHHCWMIVDVKRPWHPFFVVSR